MIKGISFLRPAGSAAAYDRLASFFSALGFEAGRGSRGERKDPLSGSELCGRRRDRATVETGTQMRRRGPG